MIADLFIDHLNGQGMGFPALLGRDTKALEGDESEIPAAFIMRFSDTGDPSKSDGPVFQQIFTDIHVLVGAGYSEMESTLKTLREASLGWQPSEDHLPLWFVSGGFTESIAGVSWWVETYRTSTHFNQLL